MGEGDRRPISAVELTSDLEDVGHIERGNVKKSPMQQLLSKFLCEFFGTFILVLIGCGSATFTSFDQMHDKNKVAVALAFGLALVAAAYSFGPVTGAHVNPAVSLAWFIADRGMSWQIMLVYMIAQFTGAIGASAVLLGIARGQGEWRDDWHAVSNSSANFTSTRHLAENGWGEGYLGEYSMGSAFGAELIFSFIFFCVILGSTGKGVTKFAGAAIGLTLVAIHICMIPVTGVSLNPARSLGPAIFVGGKALKQVWLFLVVPFLAAIPAGLIYRYGLLEE